MWAKQSTAATLIVGPILDSTGAEYTGAVIGDLSISKNGGTLTALAAAATLTHIANGQYTLVMTTGNLDTLGRLQITCNKSTYQMPPIGLNIVPAMVFDSLVLGSDRFDANVTHVGDTAQTAGDIYASQVAIAGYIDTEVGAIKAKTDQLTFTTANKVDSTAVLDSSVTNKITDINTFATRMTTALIQDGLVWQFTVNALENAPSATGVEELQATQEEILELIDTYLTSVNAAVQDTPGTIVGFPATLNVGDSYTDDMNNAITVTLVDDEDNPVDTWGSYDVNHAGFTPTLVISGSGGKVTAAVTYDTDHFLVQIPSSESLRASPGTATMQFVLKWYVDGRLVAQKTIVTGQAVTWIKQI